MSVAGAVLALLLVALAPTIQATPTVPEDTAIPPIVWELVEVTDEAGSSTEITEPERYTVQFLPDDMLAIGADCNRATATYEIQGTTLDVLLGLSTMALCPPDTLADPFQGLLEGATTLAFNPDGYLLLSGDSGELRFRPTLTGVVWEWQEFQSSDDSLLAPSNPGNYTITFLPDDKLAIKADCNRAFGSFAVDGDKLDLKVVGVTRMLCPEGSLMDIFLRDLDAVSSHVFREGKLYLALPMDAGIHLFEARYDAPAEATPEAG